MTRIAFCLITIAAVPLARDAHAQGRKTPPPGPSTSSVTIVPGPRYDLGSAARWIAGQNWRDLWQLPLTVPVLRIDTFAGGLAPERAGGNKQSTTLHFIDASGTGWVFRSVDKYPDEKLSPDVNGTPLGAMIRDQISAVHPLGGLMVPVLNDALGILHVQPVPYVMPDDPALGEFREQFAGMLGTLELKPNEGPEDSPGFAGSRKIKDTQGFFDDLEDSAVHALDEGELLRVRLIDFIINDTDRSTDQYRFVRYPHPTRPGRYLWRPLPRDRDWAFLNARGPLAVLARATSFPKFVAFHHDHPPLDAHVFTGHVVDRRLLTSLDRAAFNQEVATVQAALTDAVLQSAADRLPPSYSREHREVLAEVMRLRRDALGDIASDFYAWLATDVDVRATDEKTRAEITRHDDGRVELRLYASTTTTEVSDGNGREGSRAVELEHYHRTFLPAETREVRVFLQGGDDVAVVRGSGHGIVVRVIGGGGDDVLADSSTAPGVHFYDHRGRNTFVRSPHTAISTKPWDAPPPPEGLRVGMAWAPDWADRNYWRVAPDYTDAGGVILGFGRTWTTYGFRRLPHRWSMTATALYGLEPGEPGLELEADYNFENSKRSLHGRARWARFDGFRWYGPGNTSPSASSDDALVRMQRFSFEPSYVLRFGEAPVPPDPTVNAPDTASTLHAARGTLSAGPVLRYTSTEQNGTRFASQRPIGVEPLWQLGAGVRFDAARTDGRPVPRRGAVFRASALAFPGLLDEVGASARAHAEVNAFLPIAGDGLHLALRGGSAVATGDYAAFDAAMIGGRTTLRGFPFQRFAGDAAAYGGAELRMPLGRAQLLVNGELGVFGLFDAGRVWYDGESPGGWHAGVGGGLWFESLGRAATVSLASGERVRLYLSLAQPF